MTVLPKVFIITGPTATGKTGIAIDLARQLDAEVISADSMQVYRGFDVGTAKPAFCDLQGVTHHLIDVVDPTDAFDAARFKAMADAAVTDILRRGKRVIVAGGTGLYIRALLFGLQKAPPPDPALRTRLVEQGSAAGWPALHEVLFAHDPETARRLHPNDGVRILRALEVVLSSGRPLSEWHADHRFSERRYDARLIALSRERQQLNAVIERRVDRMMAEGFLAETRALLQMGLSPTLKPMQGLGYRRLVAHLLGECTLAEAIDQTKIDTRRFAKRQVTWFKKEQGIEWLPPDAAIVGERAADHFSTGV